MSDEKSSHIETILSWNGSLTFVPVCALGQLNYKDINLTIKPFCELGAVFGTIKVGGRVRYIVSWEKSPLKFVYVPTYAVLPLLPIFFPNEKYETLPD